MRQMFRKKVITHSDSEYEYSRLRKCLSAFDLTLLGIGCTIGTGIFVLTGIAAATQAGPAVILSFLIASIPCALAALSYAELASCVGGCGSAYGYSYAAFGEIIAWIVGWDLILEYGVAVAAVANGWSGYFNNMLHAIGVSLPDLLTRGPFDGGIVNLPAVVIILAIMGVLIMGMRESARTNAAIVFVKLITIAVFIVVALFNIHPENWDNFMPFGWFSTTPDGKTVGVFAASSLVFFAYVGFDAVSVAVEEAHNPKRDVPIGILASLAFCTVVYIVVSGLLTAIVPYTELNVSSPVAFALQKLGIRWASGLVATGVIAGLTTVMLALYYGLTRVIYAMSRDGLLPSSFAAVNEKTLTPVRATVVCGLLIAALSGFVPLGMLAELVNIGTLVAFIVVCGGVIVLRITHPKMRRPFKTPWGITLPLLGVLSCGALVMFLPLITHLRFVVWLLLGVVIYFAYSAKHSQLAQRR
ncbi:MAG: amino acid permease [Alphaproteobacteria bacterium]|nr:amino acid permease [Alphaproteobacteria bacterium]